LGVLLEIGFSPTKWSRGHIGYSYFNDKGVLEVRNIEREDTSSKKPLRENPAARRHFRIAYRRNNTRGKLGRMRKSLISLWGPQKRKGGRVGAPTWEGRTSVRGSKVASEGEGCEGVAKKNGKIKPFEGGMLVLGVGGTPMFSEGGGEGVVFQIKR